MISLKQYFGEIKNQEKKYFTIIESIFYHLNRTQKSQDECVIWNLFYTVSKENINIFKDL